MGDDRPIGIFDSGLGGLTVVNAMAKALPKESFIYVGDTARVPYGGKDADTIRDYGRQIVDFLQKKDVKAIIAACGTISSNAMEDLWKEFDLPIIDVVRPGIDACLKLCKEKNKKRVGVIATEATIKSSFFQRSLKEKNPSLVVEAKACPLFVPLIEAGLANNTDAAQIVKDCLKDWQDNPVDILILGCTHYPLLTPILSKVLENTAQVDMAVATVEVTAKYLTENNMLKKFGKANNEGHGSSNAFAETSNEFYVSGDIKKFNDMGQQITGTSINAKMVYWK